MTGAAHREWTHAIPAGATRGLRVSLTLRVVLSLTPHNTPERRGDARRRRPRTRPTATVAAPPPVSVTPPPPPPPAVRAVSAIDTRGGEGMGGRGTAMAFPTPPPPLRFSSSVVAGGGRPRSPPLRPLLPAAVAPAVS